MALGVPITLISLIDEKRHWIKSHFGFSRREVPRNDSLCAHAIVVDDARRGRCSLSAGFASDRDDQIMCVRRQPRARELGRLVVAESIRDTLARDWLRRYGCNIGQCGAISRPLDVPVFEGWLQMRT
jgi:hypothetical protein